MPGIVGKRYLIKLNAKEICRKVWGDLSNWNPHSMDEMCGERLEYLGEYDNLSSLVRHHINGHHYFIANDAIEWENEDENKPSGLRYYPSHI